MNEEFEGERKAFEEWAMDWRDSYGLPFFVLRHENGSYIEKGTQTAWLGWSARAGLLPF